MFRGRVILVYLVIIILLLSFALLSANIKKPFWGHHDWNSAVYSNIARNYIRYGYLETKFGQVTNTDFQDKDSFSYITHYPPLLSILISISFRTLGQSESSARFVPVIFSFILIFFIYQIGKEIHSKMLGIFASISAVLTPIFLYFGKLPVHDTIVPAVSTLGFWLYIKFVNTKLIKYYIFLIISLIIGGLINWSAFYLAVALVYIHTFSNVNFSNRKIYVLIPLSVFIFLLHIMHIKLLGVDSKNVLSNVLIRINPYLTADLYGFTIFNYIKQEILWIKSYYSPVIILGGATFFILFLKRTVENRTTFNQILISGMFLYGVIQLAVFSQLSFIHDYMIYYLLPFFILSFSYVTFTLFNKFKKSIIFPVILVSLILFNFLSGLNFTNALLNSAMNKRGYDAAKIIKSETSSKETPFIGSNSYKEFQEVFIAYYSDRNVNYGEKLPDNYRNKFELILRPKDHDALDQDSKLFLDQHYKRYENDKFIWYKL